MSLYKRGDVWHYSFTLKGERYRGSTHCRLKGDAKLVEGRVRRQAELGGAQSQEEDWTLGAVSDLFFAARGADKKSADDIAARLATTVRLIGRKTLVSEIGPKVIQAAIQARRMETSRRGGPLSNSTVNRDLIDQTLRPMLRFAAHNLEIPIRPIVWRELRLPEPKGRTRTFTTQELASWRANLPVWHRPVFDFFVRYGVRLGEAFFRCDAVNLERGEVVLRARKAGDDHVLPLLPEDVSDLAARIGRARAADVGTPWLREMKDGSLRPITYGGFAWASRKALDRAGIADARPAHDLRHHAATEITRRGGLKAAQDLLGHATIVSTMRYAHPDRDDLLAALGHKIGHSSEFSRKKIKENK
ncbi:tyrosine-type recombinase/integrase [Caulobacter sp. ErkDOM-E]|uniref:tyrosine-type recombinase/integrase n=1 Tax=Caulobacter sp. ErkDOM-E TaxID=3402778 RepID=UPI003AF5D1D7